MRIVHRVTVPSDRAKLDQLALLGVACSESASPLVSVMSFDIDEAHSAWPQVRDLIRLWKAFDWPIAHFTKEERDNARHLAFGVTGHQGYPQPESDFGYLSATYDLSQYCDECGSGAKQVRPFRLRGEPRWGKKHFFQLNWVFDELFTRPGVWEDVLRPLGIEANPVVSHRDSAPLSTVVQIKVTDIATSALTLQGRSTCSMCSRCGRGKWSPPSAGFFPSFEGDITSRICRTQETFGSGHNAHRHIIIDGAFYHAIRSNRLLGAEVEPMLPIKA
jgi:hypothetical protein